MRKPHPAAPLLLTLAVLAARCNSTTVTGGTPTPTPTPGCKAGGYASAVGAAAINNVVNNVPNRYTDANKALGAPDGKFVSLGTPGCYVTVDLGVNGLGDCPGSADLQVVALDSTTYQVSVTDSANGPSFTTIGQGSGTTTFDLASAGVSCTRYVRIDQLGNDSAANIQAGSPGVDVDAVHAISACK